MCKARRNELMLIELSMRTKNVEVKKMGKLTIPICERKYEWSSKTASEKDAVEIVSGEERLKAMKRFRSVVP